MIDLQGNKVLSCADPEFRHYGKLLTGFDLSDVYAWAKQVDIPEKGNAYTASDASAEVLDSVKQVGFQVYGGMPFQAGPCRGDNKVLNGIEYHNGSEVAICVKPCVMFLGKLEDMDGNTYDGTKAVPFYFPSGSVVQTYETTLHYTPCAVDDYFFTVCLLPKGTGNTVPGLPVGILKKQNKWFIAHPENTDKVKAGDYPGLLGEMRGIE